MNFGYARVSTDGQNLARQLEALGAAGVEKIYCDKISGAKVERPELDAMLSQLRRGDTVTVLSFDRLARSTKQLLDIADDLQRRGVDLISLHESIDTTTPQGRCFFTVTSAFAEMERELIKERQREGIEIAQREGRMKGRPRADADKLSAAIGLFEKGELSVSAIEKATGVSRSTIYREARRRGVERGGRG